MADEGVPFALTMSVTPPLAAMLKDELLRQRFDEHLARLEALAEREMKRLYGDARFAPVATFYRDHFARMRARVGPARGGRRGRARRGTGTRGASSCSRARPPTATCRGCSPAREGIRPQLALGVTRLRADRRRRRPRARGSPSAPTTRASTTRSPAPASASPSSTRTACERAARGRPTACTRPSAARAGVAFFGRDAESSQQVWSRDEGYPGDAFYRDFYRDIGFDLPDVGAAWARSRATARA